MSNSTDKQGYWESMLNTAHLKRVEPLLNKYFGISYGYFEDEIRNLPSYTFGGKGGEYPLLKTLETDWEIPIYTPFNQSEFLQLFDVIKENDETDGDIKVVLFLIAHIVEKQKSELTSEEMFNLNDHFEYEAIRKDVLKLYIFAHSKQPKTEQGQRLTLKNGIDKDKTELANYDNWLIDGLLKPYLNKYLPDITSIEQAKEELKSYHKKAGRPIEIPEVNIIIYGIYRMFNDLKKMGSHKSNALCKFINSYLIKIGMINEELDDTRIREAIDCCKAKSETPKFHDIGNGSRILTNEEVHTFRTKDRWTWYLHFK